MEIKSMSKADARIYRDLRLHSFEEAPYAFSESYEDEKLRSVDDYAGEIGESVDDFILGSFSGNTLTGFVTFRRDKRSKALHKSMIYAMYVHPDFRKSGVGKELVEEVIQRAKELSGLEQIHLWVLHSEHSLSASQFYSKIGFVSQGPKVMKDLKIGDHYIDAEYMVYYF